MSILGVMGPVMVGPSSSHTAGAARLGKLARLAYGRPVRKVRITLFNSFAETGEGHGTDRALAGGVLGLEVDDERIRVALGLAREMGVEIAFERRLDPDKHPNYVEFAFPGEQAEEAPFTVCGESLGGGAVRIVALSGHRVEFSGRHDVLLLLYRDVPGMVGFIGDTLGAQGINIAYMQISRDAETSTALAVLKLDDPCPEAVLAELAANGNVSGVNYIRKQEGWGSGEED
ncbi:MAG: L-serine ammonia-lyase, iron-sulfur-dependent subunit beta [Chitinophagales bacterium]